MTAKAAPASEILMDLLQRFSQQGEPTAFLIVYTTPDDVYVRANAPQTHTIGMAEYAKHRALKVMLDDTEEFNHEPLQPERRS
jgi:hypothetical protein